MTPAIVLTAYALAHAAIADIRTKKIPDVIHIILLLSGCMSIFAYGSRPLPHVLGLLLVGGTMLLIGIILGGMGGGDIKLGGSLAFAIGFIPASVALLIGLFLASAVLLAKERIQKKKEKIVLAPFIAVGGWTVLLLSQTPFFILM